MFLEKIAFLVSSRRNNRLLVSGSLSKVRNLKSGRGEHFTKQLSKFKAEYCEFFVLEKEKKITRFHKLHWFFS